MLCTNFIVGIDWKFIVDSNCVICLFLDKCVFTFVHKQIVFFCLFLFTGFHFVTLSYCRHFNHGEGFKRAEVGVPIQDF